jgi:hypothetical protein
MDELIFDVSEFDWGDVLPDIGTCIRVYKHKNKPICVVGAGFLPPEMELVYQFLSKHFTFSYDLKEEQRIKTYFFNQKHISSVIATFGYAPHLDSLTVILTPLTNHHHDYEKIMQHIASLKEKKVIEQCIFQSNRKIVNIKI